MPGAIAGSFCPPPPPPLAFTVQALLDGMLAAAQQRVAAQEQEERQVDGARQQQDAAAATEAARAPAAAPAAGACCGRKRAADSPAGLPRGSDGAVQRVVARMLASGEALGRPGCLSCSVIAVVLLWSCCGPAVTPANPNLARPGLPRHAKPAGRCQLPLRAPACSCSHSDQHLCLPSNPPIPSLSLIHISEPTRQP